MKTLQMKCELLSDIILNQKAATEGSNKTLDFIPGNCFLGIVADELYDNITTEEAMILFHSGKVRFGDAHPSLGTFRGLRVPASMYYPKLDKKPYYIYHFADLEDKETQQKQLKQCRSGFYDFSSNAAKQISIGTSFAIKSAYDATLRRSKDEQMYGYQSLQKGLTLLFEVEIEEDSFVDIIEESLVGKKRIGRSRTAQYGLVEISKHSFEQVNSQPNTNNEVAVYADGRLIFLDENGLPSLCPTPKQLGINDEQAKIRWDKSQIRTFQYAPYNYKRQSFDSDRCGIEKGSVIIVETNQSELNSQYIGSYQNEGFGRVIYNPNFLTSDINGIAHYVLTKQEHKQTIPSILPTDTPLLQHLMFRKQNATQDLYGIVNEWVSSNVHLFKGKFASQWGTIRAFAMANNGDLETQIIDYISHGIKKDDWEGKRRNVLTQFLHEHKNNKNFRELIINLASVMAKQCRDKEE